MCEENSKSVGYSTLLCLFCVFAGFSKLFHCIRYNNIMASSSNLLTPFNYHRWKEDIEIQLCPRGLYKVTMGTEVEPNALIDREKYWNKLDEAYGFLCLSISKYLLFHLTGLKTPKEIWDQLATLFYKQDDLRIYQLENELISLNLGNFETMNDFFTKFKHLVL